MLRLASALILAALMANTATAESIFEKAQAALQNRARIVQIDQQREVLQRQLDQLKDERNQLDNEQRLSGSQLVEMLQNAGRVGRCSVSVGSNMGAVTLNVTGREGNSFAPTLELDRLNRSDIRLKTEVKHDRVQAVVEAHDLRDVNGAKTHIDLLIDGSNHVENMRIVVEQKGKDLDTKECR